MKPRSNPADRTVATERKAGKKTTTAEWRPDPERPGYVTTKPRLYLPRGESTLDDVFRRADAFYRATRFGHYVTGPHQFRNDPYAKQNGGAR